MPTAEQEKKYFVAFVGAFAFGFILGFWLAWSWGC